MSYPAFLLDIGSSSLLSWSPLSSEIRKIFEDFNAELPLPTKMSWRLRFHGHLWWAVDVAHPALVLLSALRSEPGKRRFEPSSCACRPCAPGRQV
jgi:hypothetical protein